MFATVTTWRLHESVRGADAYDAFVRKMVNRNIELARRVGLMDSLMIRVEPELLIGIGVYETEEDAVSAGPIAREAVGAFDAGKLEYLSREAGPMSDMPSLPGRQSAALLNGAAQMHASISTWRLNKSLREEAVFAAYVSRVMDQNVELANEVGLLDVMVIRVSEDTIVTVGMYESLEAVDAAIQRSTRLYEEHYVADIELLDRKVGRADDIPLLTGRGD
jgi:hypothetical protein